MSHSPQAEESHGASRTIVAVPLFSLTQQQFIYPIGPIPNLRCSGHDDKYLPPSKRVYRLFSHTNDDMTVWFITGES